MRAASSPGRAPVSCRRYCSRSSMSPGMNSRARAAATLLASLVLFGAAAVGGYYWLSEQFYGPGPGREVARIQVEQGWSIRTVMAELAHSGVVRNPRAVEWYVRLSSRITGRRLRIQAGMYEIPARASP